MFHCVHLTTVLLQPRTPFEKDLAALMGRDEQVDGKYTEAELELRKAMNLKEVSFSSLLMFHI